jgi:class 3 adenylate cyclase
MSEMRTMKKDSARRNQYSDGSSDPGAAHVTTTRTLSIVVTDVVGSTQLLTRLGQDAYESIRRRHVDDLRRVLSENHGREVKTMGDGMLSAFESALDAAHCAVAMHQAVDRTARRGAALQMRVGISLGEIDLEDGDVHGLPVVEATRLCAIASPGQILCSDLVAATLQRRGGGVDLEALGTRELKGIPDEMPVFSIAWTAELLPLHPQLMTDPHEPPFVGRADELTQLREEAQRASAGEPRIVLLVGETGAGKSRLMVEVARELHGQGAIVLYGAADPLVSMPFDAFAAALAPTITAMPHDARAKRFGALAAELERLVGDNHATKAAVDERVGQDRLFGSLALLLRTLSADGLVVLFVDDIQLAGEDSHVLLRYLAGQRDLGPVLIVASIATGSTLDERVVFPLLGRLRRESTVTRIDLGGLTDDDVSLLLTETAGHRPGRARPSVVADIVDRTNGNALFVCELVRKYLEQTADPADARMPDSIRELVAVRLQALPDDLRSALAQAAVIGHDFDVNLLSRIDGRSVDELIERLDDACQMQIVRELRGTPDAYQFRHRLVREVLETSMSASRRARIHKRVIDSLEEKQDAGESISAESLSRHYANAGALADQGRALRYSMEAGTRALDARAFRDALEHFDRARQLLAVIEMHSSDRYEVLIGYASALTGIGEAEAARPLFVDAATTARDLGDANRFAETALALGAGFNPYNEVIPDPQKAALVEEAIGLLDEDDRATRGRLLISLANVIPSWDRDRRQTLADEALAVAEASGDPAALGIVLSERYGMLNRPVEHDERAALARAIVEIGEAADRPDLVLRGVSWESVAATEVGDGPTMRAAAERRAQLTDELASSVYGWNARMYRGFEAALAGNLAAAERQVMAAVSLGIRVVGADAARFCGTQLQMIRLLQGREADMMEAVRQFADQNPHHLAGQWSVVQALALEGEMDEAHERYETLPPLAEIPENFEWLFAVSWAALAAIKLEARDTAKEAAALLTPYTHMLCTAADAAMSYSVAHVLGLTVAWLGDTEQGVDLLEHARALYERLEARPWLVLATADVCGLKAVSGDLSMSDIGSLELARAEAHTIGMTRAIAAIDRLMQ